MSILSSNTPLLPLLLSLSISLIFGLELLKYDLSYGDLRSFNSAWFVSSRYFSAWQPEGLGNFDSRSLSDLVISATSVGVGNSGGIILQKILFLAPYPLSSVTMWKFLEKFNLPNLER